MKDVAGIARMLSMFKTFSEDSSSSDSTSPSQQQVEQAQAQKKTSAVNYNTASFQYSRNSGADKERVLQTVESIYRGGGYTQRARF